jgi:hypothetical protein
MYITFYSYSQGGKNYISTEVPAGYQGFPTFDIYTEMPCPHFVLENIFSTASNNTAEFIYKIHIPISQEMIDMLPVVDGHRVAHLWLVQGSDGVLTYTLQDDAAHAQVLTIDPPHPVELTKIQDISNMFLNTIGKMQAVGKKLCVKVVFRVPV